MPQQSLALASEKKREKRSSCYTNTCSVHFCKQLALQLRNVIFFFIKGRKCLKRRCSALFFITICFAKLSNASYQLEAHALLYMQTLVLHFVNNGLLPVKQTKPEKLTYYSKQDCKKAVISKTENSQIVCSLRHRHHVG